MDHEIKSIKSRSFLSVLSLLGQSSYSAALGFVAFFILTLKSGVYLLGIYNTVLAMMSFFNYFTNLGLAAAIVQKKDVEEVDLNTAFYIQFFLSTLAVIIGYFLTSYLFKYYKDLPQQAVYLYWSVLFSFFILSFKTIPSVLLEKKIKIYKVVLVQAIENTVFYLCIIIFSILNFEIFSLVIAVLARSIIGTILMYSFNPWIPQKMFSFSAAKRLLKFGIPFQGNSFLALVKDDLLIIYLGGVIGMKNLGYVTFAKKYAEFSIRLVTDNVNRVAFPVFSKLQKDLGLLKKSIEKILFFETLLTFPAIIGAIFVFDNLLKILPGYYQKWQLSLFSFYFFSLSAFFVSSATGLMSLFNAIGKVKLSLYFMIFWTVLTWIFVPIMIRFFGYNGISIAFFWMSIFNIFVFAVAKKLINFSLGKSIIQPLIASLVMGIYLSLIKLTVTDLYLNLILSISGAVAIYLTIILKKNKHLINELKTLAINSKNNHGE